MSSEQPHQNDNPPHRPSLRTDFIMAMRFYSRLPVGHSAHEIPDLSRIALALPFASIAMTIVPALVLLVLAGFGVPTLYAATLATLLNVLFTGAMAEDAIGDSADGLVGGRTPERRLEIFKDSRLGTYGVCAIVFLVLLRVGALSAIAQNNPLAAASTWLGAAIISRSASLWLPVRLGPARKDGMSAGAGRPSGAALGASLGFSALLGFALIAPFVTFMGYILSLFLVAVAALGWSALCKRLVGGQTGDLIGGLQAVLEMVLLFAFILLAGR